MAASSSDPFISILRNKDIFSRKFIRSNSPSNVVQVSLERANSANKTTHRGKEMIENPKQQLLKSMQSQLIVSSRPPSVCVNCSKPSSLCVPCSEIMCKNALTFQRAHSTLGAIDFLKKAVREAGHSRLVKLIVFSLWKNGHKVRNRSSVRINDAVRHMQLKNLTGEPFWAWKRFTAESVMNRKNKKIDELNAKVKQLEDLVRKLNADAGWK